MHLFTQLIQTIQYYIINIVNKLNRIRDKNVTIVYNSQDYITVSCKFITFNTTHRNFNIIKILCYLCDSINYVIPNMFRFGYVRAMGDIDGVVSSLICDVSSELTTPNLITNTYKANCPKISDKTFDMYDLILYIDRNADFLFDLLLMHNKFKRLIVITPSSILLLIYLHALLYYFDSVKINNIKLFGLFKSVFVEVKYNGNAKL